MTPAFMQDIKVNLDGGDFARQLLSDATFLDAWSRLQSLCPWATGFQHRGFVTTWLNTYQELYEAVVIRAESTSGDLGGLLTLALERGTGRLVVAGAHQAEYQVWLSEPALGGAFMKAAMTEVARSFPGQVLTFRYLPPSAPLDWATQDPSWRRLATLTRHPRPLVELGNGEELRASLRKRSNKSRVNRLARLGALRLETVDDPDRFAEVFDQIADQYDLRQGGLNQTLPFREDPKKKEFHVDLLRRSSLLDVTVMMLGDTVLASNIGVRSGDSVCVGILSSSPLFARHSPGKVFLLQLGQSLLDRGVKWLDLTPGGAWKERFATTFDHVFELKVHLGWTSAMRVRLKDLGMALLKRILTQLDLDPSGIRALARRLHRNEILERVRMRVRGSKPADVFVLDLAVSPTNANLPQPSLNRVADLLLPWPDEIARSRWAFLAECLENLEGGYEVFTQTRDNRLTQVAWLGMEASAPALLPRGLDLSLPPHSAVLRPCTSEPYSAQHLRPDFIAQVTAAAARRGITRIYLVASPPGQWNTKALETLGFYHRARLWPCDRAGEARPAHRA